MESERLLLIDTCGETAGVALCTGDQVLIAEDLARGTASAEILPAVRRLLLHQAWRLQDLHAIGVVSGPGSFTGIRAGLAAAKGLCEAAALRLAAVSRLEVLAGAAALTDGFTVLDAGRGELYIRDVSTRREWLAPGSDLEITCNGQPVAVAESRLAESLARCTPILRPLHGTDALNAVLRTLRAGGSDIALTDANYVREESDIYPKHGVATKPL